MMRNAGGAVPKTAAGATFPGEGKADMFSFRKNNVVTKMVEEYLDKAEQCLALLHESFAVYAADGLGAAFDELVDRTHMAESCCDDLRRQIEASLYEKALIPESRGDILNLLESVDKIPNQAESVLFHVQMQLLHIPQRHLAKFQQLVHINREAFSRLAAAIRALFVDAEKVRGLVNEVDKTESASDHLEREMIRAFFEDKELDLQTRLLLKELVIETGKISNRCENTADRITIITIKRAV